MTTKAKKKKGELISFTMVDSLKEMGIRIGDVSYCDSEAKKKNVILYFNRDSHKYIEVLKIDENQFEVLDCNFEIAKKGHYLFMLVLQNIIINSNLRPYKYVGK